MKKREIIKAVNDTPNAWEKDGKLLDLLVEDGRLPKDNRINTYKAKLYEGIEIIYYNKGNIVIIKKSGANQDIYDFTIFCDNPGKNAKANKR